MANYHYSFEWRQKWTQSLTARLCYCSPSLPLTNTARAHLIMVHVFGRLSARYLTISLDAVGQLVSSSSSSCCIRTRNDRPVRVICEQPEMKSTLKHIA